MSTPPEVSRDVVIIGGGPAGLSTALHLVRMQPRWRERIVVLEAKQHPREKPCGGAVSVPGMIVLKRLGLENPPHFVPVNALRVNYRSKGYKLTGRPIVHIHYRREFDAWLAEQSRLAGIRLYENEPALEIERVDEGFRIRTASLQLRARVIVAADGSRGSSRRLLGLPAAVRLCRLVEAVVPAPPDHELFQRREADLRFGVLDNHVQGYAWEFPVFADGRPHLNLGVFDARIKPNHAKPNLREIMNAEFPNVFGSNPPVLKGHPLHWFHEKTALAHPGVLFAGDAAGADPLFGEGISFALEYGRTAAEEIIRGFRKKDFSFEQYGQRVRSNPLLKDLPRRTRLAGLAYSAHGPGLRSLGWSLTAPFSGLIRWKEPSRELLPVD